MDDTRITTKRCEHCDGLGRVPEDPRITQADLIAEHRERARTPRPEFAARIKAAEERSRAGR